MSPPTDAPAEFTPPCNIEAEQALLGAILYDNSALESLDGLAPADFFEPFHQRLFALVLEETAKGRTAEPVGLKGRLGDDPAFLELGGLGYLADLIDRAPPTRGAPEFARHVRDTSVRRQLMRAGGEIAQAAVSDLAKDAEEIAGAAEMALTEIAASGPGREAWQDGGTVVRSAIASARARDGRIAFPTGLADLDEMTGGFNAGEVTILAGRPGMGKSLGGQAIAKANARAGLGTLLFSQEMAEEALGLRLACDVAFDREQDDFGWAPGTGNPWFDSARKNKLTADQWGRLDEAAAEVAQWPLKVDVRPSLSVSTMEACARRALRAWKRRGVQPGPVVIDHLGIVKPEADRKGNKHAETADVSRGLAIMAKRLGVPVVVLCQLNRGVEGRDDKRPQLSDLRQAGEIEEDARLVMFLYRAEYYLRPPLDPASETLDEQVERERKLRVARNRLVWIVAKNNNGALGQVETFVDVACGAIRDWRAAA